MYKKLLWHFVIILLLCSCGVKEEEAPPVSTETAFPEYTADETEKITAEEPDSTENDVIAIDYDEVAPYEVGQVMIIMYHGLVEDNPPSPYQRTIAGFKEDLQYLYDNGYRTLSLRDLIHNNITTKAGFTPVVLTFDDGIDTSFSLQTQDGKLAPSPDCAVDILNKFYESHPDFGREATFFINGNNDPFQGDGTLAERLQYLIDNGYDIGNHTYSHAKLSALNKEEIQKEIGLVDQLIRDNTKDYIPEAFSYPFGIRPQEDLRDMTANGEYAGKTYTYITGLREGQSGSASSPNRVGFEPFNMPRVRGSFGEETDLHWHFDYYEKNPEYRYISDGNPNAVAVPEKYSQFVDLDSLGDKELIIY